MFHGFAPSMSSAGHGDGLPGEVCLVSLILLGGDDSDISHIHGHTASAIQSVVKQSNNLCPLQMVLKVPTSKVLLVLATLFAVAAMISSWMPQVAASPLAPTEYEQRRMMCSTGLSDVIQKICVSGTVALGDVFRKCDP